MTRGLLVSSLLAAVVAGQYSCSGACGNAIQVKDEIVCYCHSMCIFEQPGPCCDDFVDQCPDEYAKGQVQAEDADGGSTALPNLPEGCELPSGNVLPVPENTYNFEESGQSCVDRCASTMVDDDDSLVCFCDSYCLLTADCCPDFLNVCPVDPCILALVMPQGPAPETGTCLGSCGLIVPSSGSQGYCSCESACVEDASCCPDFPDVCPDFVDESLIPPIPEVKPTSCYNQCGKGAGSCWCDYQCLDNGDCCEDFQTMCGASFGLITWTGSGSCHGKCGGAGFDCWCDEQCEYAGDCCDDYLAKCVTKDVGTCQDSCGGFGGGCWCDSKCKKYGDCCSDKADFC